MARNPPLPPSCLFPFFRGLSHEKSFLKGEMFFFFFCPSLSYPILIDRPVEPPPSFPSASVSPPLKSGSIPSSPLWKCVPPEYRIPGAVVRKGCPTSRDLCVTSPRSRPGVPLACRYCFRGLSSPVLIFFLGDRRNSLHIRPLCPPVPRLDLVGETFHGVISSF